MKKLFLGTILLALSIVFPIPTMAGVDISIGISLPPPLNLGASKITGNHNTNSLKEILKEGIQSIESRRII